MDRGESSRPAAEAARVWKVERTRRIDQSFRFSTLEELDVGSRGQSSLGSWSGSSWRTACSGFQLSPTYSLAASAPHPLGKQRTTRISPHLQAVAGAIRFQFIPKFQRSNLVVVHHKTGTNLPMIASGSYGFVVGRARFHPEPSSSPQGKNLATLVHISGHETRRRRKT